LILNGYPWLAWHPAHPPMGRAAWHGRVTTARRIAMTGLDRH
jgi:hypothetical protein